MEIHDFLQTALECLLDEDVTEAAHMFHSLAEELENGISFEREDIVDVIQILAGSLE